MSHDKGDEGGWAISVAAAGLSGQWHVGNAFSTNFLSVYVSTELVYMSRRSSHTSLP